jgi:hypothetical protein
MDFRYCRVILLYILKDGNIQIPTVSELHSNISSSMYIQESTYTVKISCNWSNSTNKPTLHTYSQSLLQIFI